MNMKKMVLIAVLCLGMFSGVSFGACKIDKVDKCSVKQVQPQNSNINNNIRLKGKFKSLFNLKPKVQTATCEFGVCSPKPPKR